MQAVGHTCLWTRLGVSAHRLEAHPGEGSVGGDVTDGGGRVLGRGLGRLHGASAGAASTSRGKGLLRSASVVSVATGSCGPGRRAPLSGVSSVPGSVRPGRGSSAGAFSRKLSPARHR